MGVFLAGPLVEELRAAPASEAPLAAGRRVLEVLVPLAYRPALKVRTASIPRPPQGSRMIGPGLGAVQDTCWRVLVPLA